MTGFSKAVRHNAGASGTLAQPGQTFSNAWLATKIALLTGASLFSFTSAAPALAQEANQTATPENGEIIVTATRRDERLSRVPASIAAVSQEELNRQGIRTVSDLASSVPNLTFRPSGQDGTTTIAIRGVVSLQGTSTTGVFLDDVPLQKRAAAGGQITGSGTPLPQLFDLERVEVLRGPQGTLFGGSSEGGAIRFISPEPSLTNTTVSGRAEVAMTEGGAPTFEAGVAVGVPLIEDKLGLRVSTIIRRNGGWIDRVDPVTLAIKDKNINSQQLGAMRFQLLYAPSAAVRMKLGLYASFTDVDDADIFNTDVPVVTVPQRSYTAGGIYTTNPATIAYTVPAHTYPAENFGTDKVATYGPNSSSNKLMVPSFTVDINAGPVSLKSITSFIYDRNNGRVDQSIGQMSPIQGVSLPYFYLSPGVNSTYFNFSNNRNGITQEVRASTNNTDTLISAVGGIFFSRFTNQISAITYGNLDAESRALTGASSLTRFGVDCGPGCAQAVRLQNQTDTELAAFGDVTIRPAAKLRLTAGVRVSRTKFSYDQTLYGALFGFTTPTSANGGVTAGSVSETPVTPKFSVAYQASPSALLYTSASKGFRVGGVNSSVPATLCSAGIAALGGIPKTYDSDSLWSYEAGAKVGLFGGKMRINASAFYIDWSNIQTRVSVPGCPQYNFTGNAASATSKGFDVDGTVSIVKELKATFAVSYTRAKYSATTSVAGLGGATTVIVNNGDPLAVSPWTANLGLEYSHDVAHGAIYISGNYQYQSAFRRTTSFPTSNYNPDIYAGNSTNIVRMRTGYRTDRVEISIVADNLLNSRDLITTVGVTAGRSRCNSAICDAPGAVAYNGYGLTYRPRTIGLTLTFKQK